MSLELEYTLHAQGEIEESYLWIKERMPAAAKRWLDELIDQVEGIASDPNRYPVAPESNKFPVEIRQMLFRKRRGQCRVLFTVDGERVVILSIRRAMRKPLEGGELPL